MSRVIVGLSGGVDSSVAAALLVEQGHEVIGVFMKNWHDTSVTISDDCPWEDDSNDALLVAEKLGIPYHTLDLSKEYKERIVDYMFDEYSAGRTPNPDVLCNREIKFDVFLKAAIELGGDYVATGHYCQKQSTIKDGKTVYSLIAGKDTNKDQSYFLCQIDQKQLSKTLFPIGHLQKSKVREIAEKKGLITSGKKDSQGLCFIGKVKLPKFLQQKLEPKEGNIVEIRNLTGISRAMSNIQSEGELQFVKADGEVVGKHPGAQYFTIGQRKGLGLGGYKDPLFIVGTNVETNTVYVVEGDRHPALFRKTLFVNKKEVHWLRDDLQLDVGQVVDYQCRIRYQQELQEARLTAISAGLVVSFKNPQKAIAAGQFVAWYSGDELIGSGVIA